MFSFIKAEAIGWNGMVNAAFLLMFGDCNAGVTFPNENLPAALFSFASKSHVLLLPEQHNELSFGDSKCFTSIE